MKSMTLEEFKKYCDENDYNIVDRYDFDKFPIHCGKCNFGFIFY